MNLNDMKNQTFYDHFKAELQKFINPNTNRELGLQILQKLTPSLNQYLEDKSFDDVSQQRENEKYKQAITLATSFIQDPTDDLLVQTLQCYRDIMNMRKLRQEQQMEQDERMEQENTLIVENDVSPEEEFLNDWDNAIRKQSTKYTHEIYQAVLGTIIVQCIRMKEDTPEKFQHTVFYIAALTHKALSLYENQDLTTNELFGGHFNPLEPDTSTVPSLKRGYEIIHEIPRLKQVKTSLLQELIQIWEDYLFQAYNTEEGQIKREHRDLAIKHIQQLELEPLYEYLKVKATKTIEANTNLDVFNESKPIVGVFYRLCVMAYGEPRRFEDPFHDLLKPRRFNLLDNFLMIDSIVENIGEKCLTLLSSDQLSLGLVQDISTGVLELELNWKPLRILDPEDVGEFEEEMMKGGCDYNISCHGNWELIKMSCENALLENRFNEMPLYQIPKFFHVILARNILNDCEDPWYGFLRINRPTASLNQLTRSINKTEEFKFELIQQLVYKLRETYYENKERSHEQEELQEQEEIMRRQQFESETAEPVHVPTEEELEQKYWDKVASYEEEGWASIHGDDMIPIMIEKLQQYLLNEFDISPIKQFVGAYRHWLWDKHKNRGQYNNPQELFFKTFPYEDAIYLDNESVQALTKSMKDNADDIVRRGFRIELAELIVEHHKFLSQFVYKKIRLTDEWFLRCMIQAIKNFYPDDVNKDEEIRNQAFLLSQENPNEITHEDAAYRLTCLYLKGTNPNLSKDWMNMMTNKLGPYVNRIFNGEGIRVYTFKKVMVDTAKAIVNDKRGKYLDDNLANIAKCFKAIFGICRVYPNLSLAFRGHVIPKL